MKIQFNTVLIRVAITEIIKGVFTFSDSRILEPMEKERAMGIHVNAIIFMYLEPSTTISCLLRLSFNIKPIRFSEKK